MRTGGKKGRGRKENGGRVEEESKKGKTENRIRGEGGARKESRREKR